MTAKELEKSITISTHDYDNNKVLVATVVIERYLIVAKAAIESNPICLEHAARNLRELLMRDIYDDQQQNLWKALADLLSVNPMSSYDELYKARTKLLEAALRQPK